MNKYILVAVMLVSPCLRGDWIDDIAQHAQGKKLDISKSVKIMEGYISKDTQEIGDYESKLTAPHKKGVVAAMRDETIKIKLEAVRLSLNHHTKVRDFIKSLPKNEREGQKFAEKLSHIGKIQNELAVLRDETSKTGTVTDAAKNTAAIVLKEGQLKTMKAALQTSFMLS